jgi:hypothetical protein
MKQLSVIKAGLLLTTVGLWSSFVVSCVAWEIHNIFSPHTGKVFIGACCATALYCYIAMNDWRSNREKLMDRLHKAEMERTAANSSGVIGSYARARVLSTEIDSLRSQLSLT